MSEHSFWGNTLKPNTTKTVKMPKNLGLVINSVALAEGKSAEFYITINDVKCLIATLNKNNCPCHGFRVLVGPDTDLSLSCFSSTGGTLSIIGSVYPAISDEDDC